MCGCRAHPCVYPKNPIRIVDTPESRKLAGLSEICLDQRHNKSDRRMGCADATPVCSALREIVDVCFALHANGTTNTPSNANAANIAHASLTLKTKAAFSI